jgi:hypothetical protein
MRRSILPVIFSLALVFAAIACAIPALSQMKMKTAVIEWYADLQGSNVTPKVETTAAGKAAFSLDFDHSVMTVLIDTRNLKDVQKIEVHIVNASSAINGPVAYKLYDSATDGSLPAHFKKVIEGQDFSTVSAVIGGGEGAVVVTTKAHPQAEVAGIVKLHKSYH